MIHQSKIFLQLSLLLLLPLLFTGSNYNGEPFVSSVTVDFINSSITFAITTDLEEGIMKPGSRFKTEQKILEKRPELLVEILSEIVLNSSYTIKNRIEQDSYLYHSLEEISSSLKKSFSVISEDRTQLTMEFSLDLFPEIAALFVKHEVPKNLPEPRGYLPSADFTGIIIVATDLKENDSKEPGKLTPALFPSVYNESLETLISIDRVHPEYAKKWGTAGYSNGFDMEKYKNRIGDYPLRILAKTVYGDYQCDLVIKDTDSDIILSSENNKKLIQEGRVIIIY